MVLPFSSWPQDCCSPRQSSKVQVAPGAQRMEQEPAPGQVTVQRPLQVTSQEPDPVQRTTLLAPT